MFIQIITLALEQCYCFWGFNEYVIVFQKYFISALVITLSFWNQNIPKTAHTTELHKEHPFGVGLNDVSVHIKFGLENLTS